MSPTFDERAWETEHPDARVEELALALARGKATSLRGSAGPARWILAADQLVVVEEGGRAEILHKPGTPERAVETLLRLRGRGHRLVNAVVLTAVHSDLEFVAIDEPMLTMRDFSEAEARSYVESHAPLDCAGAYRIEDAGIRLFSRIESDDPTGIEGLPLLATCRLFRAAGLLPGEA
jgi:septum formation protein